jgi:lipopolysaccharide export LptBFGC system permease protein LptF
VIEAVLYLVIWVVLFIWLSLALHKRRKVHLAVSITGAILALVGFWFGVLRLLP